MNEVLPLKKPKRKDLVVTTTIKNRFIPRIDPTYIELDMNLQSLVKEIWDTKYRYQGEENLSTTFARVCHAIYQYDDAQHMQEAYEAMDAKLWMPGGRIIA